MSINGDVSKLDGLELSVKIVGNYDKYFNAAVWAVDKFLYWDVAYKYFISKRLNSVLGFYILYDTAINIGNFNDFQSISSCSSYSDEKRFLDEFLNIKQSLISNSQNSKQPFGDKTENRVDMQKSLLNAGNFDLKSPMNLKCYSNSFIL